MSALAQTLRREVRVALSLKTQPLWARIFKWVVMLGLTARYHDRAWFWPAAAFACALALAGHFLYRWKTHVWTQPWGGWDDLAAGRD